MKQRTRALKAFLLSLVLIVSLVPVAFAGQNCTFCGNYINPTGWTPGNSASYHSQYCYVCQRTVYESHQLVNGACITCGYGSYYNNPAYSYCYYCHNLLNSNGYCANSSCTYYGQYRPGYSYGAGYNYCYYCNNPLNSNGYCANSSCTYYGEYRPGYGYGAGYNYCYYCNNLLNSNGYCYNTSCTHYGQYRPGYGYGAGYNYCYYCNNLLNSNGYCYNTSCTHYGQYRPGYGAGAGYNYCYYCNNLLNANGYCYNTSCTHYGQYRPGYGAGAGYNYCYYCNNLLNSNGYCYNTSCTHYGQYRPGYGAGAGYNYCYYCNNLLNANGYCYNTSCTHYGQYRPGYGAGYNYCYYCNNPLNSSGYCYNTSCTHNGQYRPGYGHSAGYDYCYYCNNPLNANGYCYNYSCSHYGEYRPGYLTDINYAASLGENVTLSAADFQKFWQQSNSTNYGTLSYVRINSVTGTSGSLCYSHSAAETSHTSTTGASFYLSPAAQQKDLSKLTFVPVKTGGKYNAGTVTINFTAYGTNRYNGQTSATGKVVITYANTNVSKIEYTCTGGYTTLNSTDFTKVYKSAVSSATSTPNFTIKFLDVPVNGKLYSAYNTYGSTGTELTAANINILSFANTTSTTNSISKITYVPGRTSLGDTVRYAAYANGTLQYVGIVTFTTKEVVINYGSSSTGVTFSSGDFYYSDGLLSNVEYISFGTPSSGTLYKNYSNGKGTAVTKNDYFAHTASSGIGSLNSVTFVPKANFTGVVTIPFYAYNISGGYSTGTVKVYVVAKAFSDVSGWSASYINRLYASGVVGGTSATTFSPKANMKYGEALKMIMLAAGYPKQSETGGKHWASNYLSLAYTKRIVSSTNIDLNALVDRNTVAELAAKALGLDKATTIDSGVIAPIDSSNGYVYALYNAGIVGGEIINGSSYFYGNRNISREEVAKIICNIMDYEK